MVNSYEDMMGSPTDYSNHTETKIAMGDDIPVIKPQAPTAPLSPYEQYNVSAGQGKSVPPMRKWGIKDMTTGK